MSRYFSGISYSVYLLHWPITVLVVKFLMRFAPQTSWQTAEVTTIVAVALVTLPLSHLTYNLIEAPAMELGKRLASRFPRRSGIPATDPLPSPFPITAQE